MLQQYLKNQITVNPKNKNKNKNKNMYFNQQQSAYKIISK